MSKNASGLPPRRRRGQRVGPHDRHGRRLELVTDSWIAELADLAVPPRRASRRADGSRATIVRIVERDSRRGSAPSSPA